MGKMGITMGAEACKNREVPNTGVIKFTDATLRDGEQCGVAEISTQKRVEVFDRIVSTGIDVIEVGHGGNETDWDLVQALVERTRQDPSKYKGIRIQVLFGSQPDIITKRANELGELLTEEEKDKFIFHVYDREDEYLRNLATEGYSREQSADKVAAGIAIAREHGFRNFSISGESATGSTPEQAAEFYNRVIGQVFKQNPEEIEYFNVNLANTYGKTMGEDTAWDRQNFANFTQSVRRAAQLGGREKPLSLSIHSHNDYGTAIGSSIMALECGFDRVEGTMFGMGERLGNVALCDVVLGLTERARESVQNQASFFAGRVVCSKLVEGVGNWHQACQEIAELYSFKNRGEHDAFFKLKREVAASNPEIIITTEAFRRLHATAFGNPSAFEAGSGPHDHGTKGHFEKPERTPGWQQYLYSSMVRAILGDPKTQRVLAFDPKLAEEITLNKHTGGGSTAKIAKGNIAFASKKSYDKARADAIALIEFIKRKMIVSS